MRELNPDGSMKDEDRDAWMVGFEWNGTALVCDECSAMVPKAPARASRHRQWHLEMRGGR